MPGSGKSTWAKAYQASHPNTVIVSSDAIREQLSGKASNMNHEKEVWPEFLRQVTLSEKGQSITIIGDSTNLTNAYRSYYAEKARPHFDKLVLVAIDVPYEVCQIRNKQRTPDHVVPDHAMERMLKEFEPLSEQVKKQFDEIIVLDESGNRK